MTPDPINTTDSCLPATETAGSPVNTVDSPVARASRPRVPVLRDRSVLDPTSTTEYTEVVDQVDFHFNLAPNRRDFLALLGLTAGLLIAVTSTPATAQETGETGARRGRGTGRGGRGASGPSTIAARVHIAPDGKITVLTGKVEGGQGARTELTQAAAEELHVSPSAITLITADTAVTPNDGGTYGSQSTPRTVPAVRRGCAAARQLLLALAAKDWNAPPESLKVDDGKITGADGKSLTYADLARGDAKTLEVPVPQDAPLTPVDAWQALGKPLPRPNARDVVTGHHEYPSDVNRPGMLYGKILRPPAFGAKLTGINPAAAKAMKDVILVQDTDFAGAVAPTSFAAQAAVDAIAPTAKWETKPDQPSSADLFDYLRKNARGDTNNPLDTANAAKHLKATYHVPYVQHAPLEPRAAVAEWDGDKVTIWTGSQNPFNVRSEVARAFNLPEQNVRVIIPDFGGAFGGKHSGEHAVEAARLAKTAGKPVHLRWTRKEEFTWAYFRAAALVDMEATLDDAGKITTWHHLAINYGNNELDPPYAVARKDCRFLPANAPPLRHGSYRSLATTPNTFARESFVDELAQLAGQDPLEFRLAHIENNDRLRNVLTEAAKRFDWANRAKSPPANTGVGLACGTDKGSVVACCAEVTVDPGDRSYKVTRITQVFECGKVLNPQNLHNQVAGAVVMGLGPAMREEMRFENGKMLNASFGEYHVPRFEDVPFAHFDVHLLDRPDLPSAGAGETPIIAIAPAVANALYNATKTRLRTMPLKLTDTATART